MSSGKIYGFIGPIKGGKSYQLNRLKEKCEKENRAFINADFSDGIRQTALNILGVTDSDMDVLSGAYQNWKNDKQKISIPVGQSLMTTPISGREILKNIGEYLKLLAGSDIWARYTSDAVICKYYNIASEDERWNSVVAFGSVRFREEVDAMFRVARILEKEVELRFCNFNNEIYRENVHISESLANILILRDCKDNDNITDKVVDMLNIQK